MIQQRGLGPSPPRKTFQNLAKKQQNVNSEISMLDYSEHTKNSISGQKRFLLQTPFLPSLVLEDHVAGGSTFVYTAKCSCFYSWLRTKT